jgi:rsbT co-antagonist protein RsbR
VYIVLPAHLPLASLVPVDPTAPRDEIDEIDALKRERDALRAELAALRKERDLMQTVLDCLPEGVHVVDATWTNVVVNKVLSPVFPVGSKMAIPDNWAEMFMLYLPDMKTHVPVDQMPLVQAMNGKELKNFEIYTRRDGGPFWNSFDAYPVRDEEGQIVAAMVVYRDITAHKALEQDLAARGAALAAAEAENEDLIARLRAAVKELSTPVLEVWDGVLALPVVGVVDSPRGAEMTERLLHEITRTRARFALIDLTGVELLDTGTAARFVELARAVELLGAKCVLTGIRPAVAQALVHLDVGFGSLLTTHNLKHGLHYCLSRLRDPR